MSSLNPIGTSKCGLLSDQSESSSAGHAPHSLKQFVSWTAEEVFTFIIENVQNRFLPADSEKLQDGKVTGTILYLYGTDFNWWKENYNLTPRSICDIIYLMQSVSVPFQPPEPPLLHVTLDDTEEFLDKVFTLGASIKRFASRNRLSVERLSDPSQHFLLPFPALQSQQSEVNLTDGKLPFVGRAKVKELYSLLLPGEDRSTRSQRPDSIHLYGTKGYGRSYIIAATVLLLMAEGKRVVYIPDCSKLLDDPVRELRTALYLTFYDKPKRRAKVSKLRDSEALGSYLLDYDRGNLIYIFDNYFALQEGKDKLLEANLALEETKSRARYLIQRISADSQRLFCSSANDWIWRLQSRGYQGLEAKMQCQWVEWVGGFTEEEATTWWKMQTEVPASFDKTEIDYMTGRVPSFLCAAVENLGDWKSGISRFYDDVLNFFSDFGKWCTFLYYDERLDRYYQNLRDAVLVRKSCKIDCELFDYRYFHQNTKGEVHATAPFLLRAAYKIVYRHDSESITFLDFIDIIKRSQDDLPRTDLATISQGAIIAYICTEGLQVIDQEMTGPVVSDCFYEPYPSFVPDLYPIDIDRYLLVPGRFNSPSSAFIDFLLLRTAKRITRKSAPADTVFSYPIRISLSSTTHCEREEAERRYFRAIQAEWKHLFEGDNVRQMVEHFFVWITPGPDNCITRTEKEMPMNALGFDHPIYTQIHISFRCVSQSLHDALVQANAFDVRHDNCMENYDELLGAEEWETESPSTSPQRQVSSSPQSDSTGRRRKRGDSTASTDDEGSTETEDVEPTALKKSKTIDSHALFLNRYSTKYFY